MCSQSNVLITKIQAKFTYPTSPTTLSPQTHDFRNKVNVFGFKKYTVFFTNKVEKIIDFSIQLCCLRGIE